MSTVADLPPSSRLLTGNNDSWQGSLDGGTREDVHTWVVRYQESNAFYNVLLGPATTISYGNGSSVTRHIPLQHPDNPLMYAKKFSWKGIDGFDKPAGARYAWVKINVTFAYPEYSLAGQTQGGGNDNQTGYPPFVSISGKGSSRIITDTSRKYTATNTNGTSQSSTAIPVNQNVGVHVGANAFQLTLYQIPNLFAWITLIDPLKGKVNSTPFNLGSFQCDVGTLLLETYGFETDIDVMGNEKWTGTVDLISSALPWNSIIIGGDACSLSPKPYKSGDLNTLYL